MIGKLYVVGIGPGGSEHITPAALQAIAAAQVVVGYKTYLDLIPQCLAGKEVVSSGMCQEVERCRQALELAATGRTVALISSGDAGIYGMAGLVLELAEQGGYVGAPLAAPRAGLGPAPTPTVPSRKIPAFFAGSHPALAGTRGGPPPRCRAGATGPRNRYASA